MNLFLPYSKRPLGVLVLGTPGLGKSSLLQNMILQDVNSGKGVCVIDPTADLVNVILNWIPESRKDDCIWFDTDSPIPIDFFSYRNESERQVLTDQLVSLFALGGAPISRPRLIKLIGTLLMRMRTGDSSPSSTSAISSNRRKSVKNFLNLFPIVGRIGPINYSKAKKNSHPSLNGCCLSPRVML